MTLFWLLFPIAGATLVANTNSDTVVSLFTKGVRPEVLSGQRSLWTENLNINGKDITCSLNEDPDKTRAKNKLFTFKAALAPLNGLCVSSHGIRLCPNDRVEIARSGGKTDVFTVSQQPSREMMGDQFFVKPGGQIAAVAVCQSPTDSARDAPKRICRIGDKVPNDSSSVILETFAHEKVAMIKSTRSPRDPARRVPWSSIGCDTDGTIGDSEYTSRLLKIESVSELSSGVIKIYISSPLCGSMHLPGPPEELLNPVRNGCFVAEFLHREIEYCHGTSKFRLVQRKRRLGHDWPTALPLVSTEVSPWQFDAETKSLEAKFSTSQSCAAVQPFMSEEYIVSLPRMSFKAVGGSFTPMTFLNETGVEGVLVFDPRRHTACQADAYPDSLLPPSGHPWIALADRGGCMFQEKALVAQARGASGMIVINPKDRPMIPAMAGMPEKPLVDIHTVLIDFDGAILKSHVGSSVAITSAGVKGQSQPGPSDTLSLKVSFTCDPQWDSGTFARSCQTGDSVKLIRDGENEQHLVEIIERVNSDTFRIQTPGASFQSTEVVPGTLMDRDAMTPCTAQFGTFVRDVVRSDTCELSLTIHSNFLCADKRFREPLRSATDIVCEFV